MTEQEWLEETDPEYMLPLVREKVSCRKLRLLAVAACRTIWHLLAHAESRHAIEIAERTADGNASEQERRDAETTALRIAEAEFRHWDAEWVEVAAMGVRYWAASAAAGTVSVTEDRMIVAVCDAAMALAWSEDETLAAGPGSWAGCKLSGPWGNIFRDIAGNPFRPITGDPSWQSLTVVSLAQAIYDERAFDRLPILADALEDAGCDNADILNHCRLPGEHARGCWLVDLLLGRE